MRPPLKGHSRARASFFSLSPLDDARVYTAVIARSRRTQQRVRVIRNPWSGDVCKTTIILSFFFFRACFFANNLPMHYSFSFFFSREREREIVSMRWLLYGYIYVHASANDVNAALSIFFRCLPAELINLPTSARLRKLICSSYVGSLCNG